MFSGPGGGGGRGGCGVNPTGGGGGGGRWEGEGCLATGGGPVNMYARIHVHTCFNER